MSKMSVDSKNIIFGYFDEEFVLKKLDTPRAKFQHIERYTQNGCLDMSGRKLRKVPFEFIVFAAHRITVLTLDKNCFKDLSFLSFFPNLAILSLNRNPDPDCTTLPFMPHLETLSLNSCGISDLYKWLHTIRKRCPRIVSLSVRSSFFENDKVTNEEATNRRRTIIGILPRLLILDEIRVSDCERDNAKHYAKSSMKKNGVCCIL